VFGDAGTLQVENVDYLTRKLNMDILSEKFVHPSELQKNAESWFD
jgi:hypothetical protein